jgi:hypothetical protein
MGAPWRIGIRSLFLTFPITLGATACTETEEIPLPQILDFSADSEELARGAMTTLRWSTQDAVSVRITQGDLEDPLLETTEPEGSVMTPSLIEAEVFTLVASNGFSEDDVVRQVAISVAAPIVPEILSFEPEDPEIARGESTTLVWTTRNATGITLRTQDGQTVVTTPGDEPFPSPGGLLALPGDLGSNMGSFERNRFALLPELALRLNCQLTECLSVGLGYNLLYLTETVRAGDQIDYAVNPTLLPGSQDPVTGEIRPLPRVKSTSFWAQGLQFGGSLRF